MKLVLHALHENELPFINDGQHVEWAPEIPIWLLSLAVIIVHPRRHRRRQPGQGPPRPDVGPRPADSAE